MAGNFWQSSHYQQWILDKQDLKRERQADLQKITEDEYQKIMIFFANFIQTLGEHVKVRQQVIAAATVYFKRFYARNSLKSIDPLLMAPTCIFLASKVEEFGPISQSRLISICQSVVRKYSSAFNQQDFPYKSQEVLQCEFYLLEMLDCCLILYHPYRALLQYIAELEKEEQLLKLAWRLVNDSLRTDVCLLYPPYCIALAAIHMAAVYCKVDVKEWFAELTVDITVILDICMHILRFHELWKSYKEQEEIGAILAKMPKPQIAPSRPPSQGPNGQDGSAQGSGSQGQQGQS